MASGHTGFLPVGQNKQFWIPTKQWGSMGATQVQLSKKLFTIYLFSSLTRILLCLSPTHFTRWSLTESLEKWGTRERAKLRLKAKRNEHHFRFACGSSTVIETPLPLSSNILLVFFWIYIACSPSIPAFWNSECLEVLVVLATLRRREEFLSYFQTRFFIWLQIAADSASGNQVSPTPEFRRFY